MTLKILLSGLAICLFVSMSPASAEEIRGCFLLQPDAGSCESCDSIRFEKDGKFEIALGCDTLGKGRWYRKQGRVVAKARVVTYCTHYIEDDVKDFEKKCLKFERNNTYTARFLFKKRAGSWFMKKIGENWVKIGRLLKIK